MGFGTFQRKKEKRWLSRFRIDNFVMNVWNFDMY